MTDKEREIFTYMQTHPRVPFEDVAIVFHTTYDEVLKIAVDGKLWG